MNTLELSIALIRRDGGTQPRAAISSATVDEYADSLAEGELLPPVVVFHDGADYWLADGFHRLAAAEKGGFKTFDCDVRQGTRREAVLFSVGVNAQHGLRRTNADKRRAVETLLRDAEWRSWSNSEIARRCAVSHPFVGEVRAILKPLQDSDASTAVENGLRTELS